MEQDKMMSLAEACRHFETNEPPIADVQVYFSNSEARVFLDNCQVFRSSRPSDDNNNIAVWRQLGRAIGKISTIRHLRLELR
jgi:hypothetical protein